MIGLRFLFLLLWQFRWRRGNPGRFRPGRRWRFLDGISSIARTAIQPDNARPVGIFRFAVPARDPADDGTVGCAHEYNVAPEPPILWHPLIRLDSRCDSHLCNFAPVP